MQHRRSLNRKDIYISGELLKMYLMEYTKIPLPAKGYGRKSSFVFSILKLGMQHVKVEYSKTPLLINSGENEQLITYLSGRAMLDFNECIDTYKEENSDMLKILLYIGLKKKREQDEQRLAKSRLAKGV